MADRVFAHGHQLSNLRRRLGQAKAVLDVAFVLANLLRELADRVAEVGHLAIHPGLLERGDVLALKVLDNRYLQGRLLIEVDHDGGDRLALGEPRGAPAALTGDQLVLVADGPHEDGLQDAVFADAVGELGERILLVREAGLGGVGKDALDRHFTDLRVCGPGLDQGDDARTEIGADRLVEEPMDVLPQDGALASQVRSPPVQGRGRHAPRSSWRRTP